METEEAESLGHGWVAMELVAETRRFARGGWKGAGREEISRKDAKNAKKNAKKTKGGVPAAVWIGGLACFASGVQVSGERSKTESVGPRGSDWEPRERGRRRKLIAAEGVQGVGAGAAAGGAGHGEDGSGGEEEGGSAVEQGICAIEAKRGAAHVLA